MDLVLIFSINGFLNLFFHLIFNNFKYFEKKSLVEKISVDVYICKLDFVIWTGYVVDLLDVRVNWF